MANVDAVAAYIVENSNAAISTIKLQKLVHFAQVRNLN